MQLKGTITKTKTTTETTPIIISRSRNSDLQPNCILIQIGNRTYHLSARTERERFIQDHLKEKEEN